MIIDVLARSCGGAWLVRRRTGASARRARNLRGSSVLITGRYDPRLCPKAYCRPQSPRRDDFRSEILESVYGYETGLAL